MIVRYESDGSIVMPGEFIAANWQNMHGREDNGQ
jgi:hypothetical protein